MEKYNPWNNLPNGIYAVAADGTPIEVANATSECIAVALIVNDAPVPQRLMIEKNSETNTTSIKAAYEADGATNTDYTRVYWGMYKADIESITNYTETGGGGTSDLGYLPRADGSYADSSNKLSSDYTTWTSGALSDFNGKVNTAAIIDTEDTDSYTDYANMGTYCIKFNETTSENQGYSDWYIPACGQLALLYLNRTDINEALEAIGGTTLEANVYWSSSEYSSISGWDITFELGGVHSFYKYYNRWVRFVRDL